MSCENPAKDVVNYKFEDEVGRQLLDLFSVKDEQSIIQNLVQFAKDGTFDVSKPFKVVITQKISNNGEPDIIARTELSSPLLLAIICSKPVVASWLVKQSNCNLNDFLKIHYEYTQNDKNHEQTLYVSPLYYALDKKQFDVVKELIKNLECNINIGREKHSLQTANQRELVGTIIHKVIEQGNLDVLKQLLTRKDLDLNVSINGKTPLEAAALLLSDKKEVIIELLTQKRPFEAAKSPSEKNETTINLLAAQESSPSWKSRIFSAALGAAAVYACNGQIAGSLNLGSLSLPWQIGVFTTFALPAQWMATKNRMLVNAGLAGACIMQLAHSLAGGWK